MPELPEVETVARTLRPHVEGCAITGATLLRDSSLHPLSLRPEDLRGCVITGVSRRGKLLLLELDAAKAARADLRGATGLRLALHLRMTGRLMTYAAHTAPGPHTRCVFDLTDAQGQERRLFLMMCGPLACCWQEPRKQCSSGASGGSLAPSRWN